MQDELIRAKTEAVNLVTADLSARGKNTLDELEDLKVEMKNMQRKFAEEEAKWREERTMFKVEIENKTSKLSHVEDQLNAVEKQR
jgi:hypothetical protein